MGRARLGKVALVGIVVAASVSLWASAGIGAPNGGGGPDNGTPNGAGVRSSDKLPVWNANRLSCGGNNPVGSPIVGSVVLKADRDTVAAEISLKDGRPNATYGFLLLQTPESSFGCFGPADGTLTTNAQGNGNVHITVRRLSNTTGAWVLALPAGFDNVLSPVYTFGAK